MTGILGGLIGTYVSRISPAFEHIATTVLGTAVNTVDFTSLDTYSADYKHLQIRFTAKNTGTNNEVRLRFNDITTNSYAWHFLRGQVSGVSGGSVINTGFISLTGAMAASTVTSAFGGAIVDIVDAYSTSKNTTIKSSLGIVDSLAIVRFHSGFLNNTASITKVELTTGANNFAVGSTFSIYGIRG